MNLNKNYNKKRGILMKPYRYFKVAAKLGLSGSLIKCMVAFLFITLLPRLAQLLSGKFAFSTYQFLIIMAITTLVIIPCFKMGAISFLFDSLLKKETSLGNMFDGFKYIIKLIPLTVVKIVSYLPFALVIYLAYTFLSPETMDTLMEYANDPMNNIQLLATIADRDFYVMFLSELGIIISIIISIIITSYVALTMYILYDEKLSGIKAVLRSIKLMKGNILYYIGFNLSFIFWYFASSLTFGYSDLYLNPYKEASFIMFYSYLKHKNNEPEIIEIKTPEIESLKEE